MKCVRCGCTDERACEGGCGWISKEPPICSVHLKDIVLEAERWRAFIHSQRFSVLGTGGKGADLHIGLEIWGRHPKNARVQENTESARKLLTKYADDRRKDGYQ